MPERMAPPPLPQGSHAGSPADRSGDRLRYDKVDLGRLQFDSGEMTQVIAPNQTLLEISRGEMPEPAAKPPRRSTWFILGLLAGAAAVWLAIGDVRGDVYHARIWTANVLRSLRGPAAADEPAVSIETSSDGQVRAIPERGATAANVPTVDVSQLPRAKPPVLPAAPAANAPAAQPSAPAPSALPVPATAAAPAAAAQPPTARSESAASARAGSPELANAPGPR